MISMIWRVSANAYTSATVDIDPGRARAEHGRRGSSVPVSRVTIDPELLRQLYVVEGLSARDIATKLGCAGATILRRLRRLGVNVRPTGPVPYSRAKVLGIDWSPEIAYSVGLMATDGNLGRRKASCRWFPRIWTRSRRCGAVFGSRPRSRAFEARLGSFTRFSGATVVCMTGSSASDSRRQKVAPLGH